jgi:hypothetical protein
MWLFSSKHVTSPPTTLVFFSGNFFDIVSVGSTYPMIDLVLYLVTGPGIDVKLKEKKKKKKRRFLESIY